MPTLSQITQSIMQDPDNQSFTSQGIEPLFAAFVSELSADFKDRKPALTLSDKLPELKPKKVVYIGMIKAVIAYVNGWVWIAIPFIILVCLLSSRWTFITLEKVNPVIYHRAKASQKNGIR